MKMILNDGFIRVDAVEASDLSVVNAARVSFGKLETEMDERNKGLIAFLMRERHGSPFEHNMFRFHVRVPIFVAREWMRHRAGWSYNEYSARYTVMDDSGYVPDVQDVRAQVGKPGAYTFEPLSREVAITAMDTIEESIGHSYRTYNYLLKLGVAKELARSVLPVGMYTEFFATCNARSLMHFISLRAAETAQHEIRVVAKELEAIFAEHMPVTAQAFTDCGRMSP